MLLGLPERRTSHSPPTVPPRPCRGSGPRSSGPPPPEAARMAASRQHTEHRRPAGSLPPSRPSPPPHSRSPAETEPRPGSGPGPGPGWSRPAGAAALRLACGASPPSGPACTPAHTPTPHPEPHRPAAQPAPSHTRLRPVHGVSPPWSLPRRPAGPSPPPGSLSPTEPRPGSRPRPGLESGPEPGSGRGLGQGEGGSTPALPADRGGAGGGGASGRVSRPGGRRPVRSGWWGGRRCDVRVGAVIHVNAPRKSTFNMKIISVRLSRP